MKIPGWNLEEIPNNNIGRNPAYFLKDFQNRSFDGIPAKFMKELLDELLEGLGFSCKICVRIFEGIPEEICGGSVE